MKAKRKISEKPKGREAEEKDMKWMWSKDPETGNNREHQWQRLTTFNKEVLVRHLKEYPAHFVGKGERRGEGSEREGIRIADSEGRGDDSEGERSGIEDSEGRREGGEGERIRIAASEERSLNLYSKVGRMWTLKTSSLKTQERSSLNKERHHQFFIRIWLITICNVPV